MKRSPSNSRASGGTCASAWIPAAALWIALSASHGRAECPRAPVEGPRRVDVAQAAGVDRVGRRLHDDHEVGVAQRRLALEQPGERALGDRQLLAPEEHVAEVDRRRRARQRQLDHHGERALHVGGAEPVDRVGVAPAGTVALRRDGVEVPGQEHERALAALRRAGQHAGVARVARVDAAAAQDAEHVRGQGGLVARLRRDVDELERAGGEAIGQGHAPAGYPANAGGAGRRPRRAGERGRAGPAPRACWASCRAGACCAG